MPAATYAPRYRQAGQSAQDGWKNFNWQSPPDGDAAAATTDAAMRLAYGDVSAAFSNCRRATGPSSSRRTRRAPSTSRN